MDDDDFFRALAEYFEKGQISSARASEWIRTVEENSEFLGGLRDLQNKYNFPLPNLKEFYQLIDEHPEKMAAFNKSLRDLMEAHRIDSRWITPIMYKAAVNFIVPRSLGSGFPTICMGPTEKMTIVIDQETNLTEPVVLEFIKREQLKAIQRDDPIPKPIPDRNNGRKLDWRPVWEWKKRHPNMRHEDIAKELNYNPVTVRRALACLDNQN